MLKEVLKELDMDIEDVADSARARLSDGIQMHLVHRHAASRTALDATLSHLRATIAPALGGTSGVDGVLPRSTRVEAERAVGRALTQLPGVLGSNDAALHSLLTSLNLTDPANASALALAKRTGGKQTAPPALVRMLRSATGTHCDGLRRQEAREEAIRSLQKLLIAEVSGDELVPPMPDDDHAADGPTGGSVSEAARGRTGGNDADDSGGSADANADTASSGPVPSWASGGALVATVYGGFEEQAREMSAVELLLDVLRMAQLQEDEIRKGDRAELEKSVKEFQASLEGVALTPLATHASGREDADAPGASGGADALRAAGWRPVAPGEWGGTRVSQLLREGGGDGSDFALAVAVLAHSIGTRVRLALICLPASAFAAAAAEDGEADGGWRQRHCRLVAEARVGFHPSAAAGWVADRHGHAHAHNGDALLPNVHFRREANGATWLSLAMGATNAPRVTEQQPGGAYLFGGHSADAAEWITFYPMDEHGCKWHVRGAEGDSTGRVHGSPAPQWVPATADAPPLAQAQPSAEDDEL